MTMLKSICLWLLSLLCLLTLASLSSCSATETKVTQRQHNIRAKTNKNNNNNNKQPKTNKVIRRQRKLEQEDDDEDGDGDKPAKPITTTTTQSDPEVDDTDDTAGDDYANHTAPDGNIINGTTAGPGAFPWMVRFPSGACQGTLIRGNRVLTSATCVFQENYPEYVYAKASTDSDGERVKVSCHNIHPNFFHEGNALYNDLAVLHLESFVEVDPVKFNTNTSYPSAVGGQKASAVGFGATQVGQASSMTLQANEMNTTSTVACQLAYPEGTIDRVMHLCAFRLGKGICTGDSGAALLDARSSLATQIGIASFTFGGCASRVYPDVFTNVALYSNWIQNQLTDNFCYRAEPVSAPAQMPTMDGHPVGSEDEDDEDCLLLKILDSIVEWFTGGTVDKDNQHVLGADDGDQQEGGEAALTDASEEEAITAPPAYDIPATASSTSRAATP